MQRDKAALAYHGGQSQLRWAFDLLAPVCAATFVSVRPDQRSEVTRAEFPQLVDRQPGLGPIAGISAALLEHPKAAWLVLACDLPFLTAATLQHLVAHRDEMRIATAYRSRHDGLPEPLCAVWEPAARDPLRAYIESGKQCPRKFLINADTALLDLPEARALDNVNTTDEYLAAQATLAPGDGLPATGYGQTDRTMHSDAPVRSTNAESRRRTVRVQYYAVLREQAGRSEETIDTTAATPADLYEELRARHAFRLTPSQLKVAINADFSDWQSRLSHGDTVVFIPPVAGG